MLKGGKVTLLLLIEQRWRIAAIEFRADTTDLFRLTYLKYQLYANSAAGRQAAEELDAVTGAVVTG